MKKKIERTHLMNVQHIQRTIIPYYLCRESAAAAGSRASLETD